MTASTKDIRQLSIRKIPLLDFANGGSNSEHKCKGRDIKGEINKLDLGQNEKNYSALSHTLEPVTISEDSDSEKIEKIFYLNEIESLNIEEGNNVPIEKQEECIKVNDCTAIVPNVLNDNITDSKILRIGEDGLEGDSASSYNIASECGQKFDISKTFALIADKFALIDEEVNLTIDLLVKQCLTLAYEIGKKIVGVVVEQIPEKLVHDFLIKTLKVFQNESYIEVQIHPEIYEYIKKDVADISLMHKKIKITPNTDVHLGDCILSWKEGKLIKNNSLLLQEIEDMLKNYIK